MPISLKEIKNYDNSSEIKDKIYQILKRNKGNGLDFNELEFLLINEKLYGLKIGGKFFLYNLIKELVHDNIIKSVISQGKEYFFIE